MGCSSFTPSSAARDIGRRDRDGSVPLLPRSQCREDEEAKGVVAANLWAKHPAI